MHNAWLKDIFVVFCLFFFGSIICTSTSFAEAPTVKVITQSSLAMIGTPVYPNDFSHFHFTNPSAPKGGALTLAGIGSFDSLNQYTTKGHPPDYLFSIYDRLMTRSLDEPYTLYPLLALSVEYPEDFSWIAFNINPSAYFHDGQPVTADDIMFTTETLKQYGSPFFRRMLQHLEKVKVTGKYRVQFDMDSSSRTIKAIALLAYLPVLPKHFWQDKNFEQNTLDFPLGSGPMRVSKVIPGKSITYQRVKNYWGANLPVNQGLHNFDQIRIDYYRDNHTSLEAFSAGAYDLRIEGDARNWHQKYDFPAIKKGEIIKESIKLNHPHGMNALVFNTRKPLFQDRNVRLALNLLFNFEWTNRNLLHSEYLRTNSFFVNTPMAASEIPSDGELKLLYKYKAVLPEEIFHNIFRQPESNQNGQNRRNKSKALQLLSEAGWQLKKGEMRHKASGQPLAFELLLPSTSSERYFIPYRKTLSELGIKMTVLSIDQSLFRKRAHQFDFDMIDWYFWHSSFPGIEQHHSWSSQAADEPGSNNLAGVKHPVVDALLARFNHVRHYQESIDICKAIDRILLWYNYVIPKWHKNNILVAYKKHLKHPDIDNLNWFNVSLWWLENEIVSSTGKP